MIVERYKNNPVLAPNIENFWEAEAVFNGCPIKHKRKTYLLYRALSKIHYKDIAQARLMVSDVAIAESSDGINFKNRRRFITPEQDWEKFGCEDPRVTKLDDKYYVFYTALSQYPFCADGIKVALAITKDFETIQERHLVTPFNAKGMALFPEKIKGKYWGLLTVNTDRPPARICLVSFDKEEDMWSEPFWTNWYRDFDKHALLLERSSMEQVEVGAPPIKTKYGWLLLYSHAREYFTPNPIFTVEAVLLDLENPTVIVGRTDAPILYPQEYYERIGFVKNVVFPSGALLKDDWIYLYYGAADTSCGLAKIKLSSLLNHILGKTIKLPKFERVPENPIMTADPTHNWENKAVFNPASLYMDGEFHIVYRAMGNENTSVMGYATSKDGVKIEYRSTEPIYVPRESFEQKNVINGNSGCEDPRLTRMGSRIFMTYTAYDSINFPRVALTSIKKDDFVERKWNWEKPVLISAPGFDDKDAVLFPQKFDGKYLIVHRSGEDMDLAFCDTLDFNGTHWLEEYRWVTPRKGWWDSKRIGASTPPIKTKDGWLLLYHGISDDNVYRIGALLLNLKNPVEIIARTDEPIFEPEMHYEKNGQVSNVVFPCGANLKNGEIYIFYGGGDSVIGVAKINLRELLRGMKGMERN